MENWLPVVGYEGLYEVSDLGRMKSLAKWKGAIWKPDHIMTPFLNKRGYYQVILRKDEKQRIHLVHITVCRAFQGDKKPGQLCDHEDHCTTNNRSKNLRWLSPGANATHRIAKNALGIRNVKFLPYATPRPWEVRIKKDGVLAYRDQFETLLDAAAAKIRAKRELHGV